MNNKVVEWTIERTDFKTVKHYCLNYHYLNQKPSGSSYNFLIKEEGEEVGIIAFGQPVSAQTYKQFKLNGNHEVVELLRVAFKEHKNYLSMYIAHAIKEIKKDNKYKILVSYSDLGEGHLGTLYKSVNFTNDGISKGSGQLYKDEMNTWRDQRTVSRKMKNQGLTKPEGLSWKQYIESLGYTEWKPKTDKIRWTIWFDKKAKKKYDRHL